MKRTRVGCVKRTGRSSCRAVKRTALPAPSPRPRAPDLNPRGLGPLTFAFNLPCFFYFPTAPYRVDAACRGRYAMGER